MGGKDNLFIASCDQKGLMGFNIALTQKQASSMKLGVSSAVFYRCVK